MDRNGLKTLRETVQAEYEAVSDKVVFPDVDVYYAYKCLIEECGDVGLRFARSWLVANGYGREKS